MDPNKDYYKILGVRKNASKQSIKKAYKNLMKKHHPDVSKAGGADSKSKEINEAKDVLLDAEKRKEYNELRKQLTQPKRPRAHDYRKYNYRQYDYGGYKHYNPFEDEDFKKFYEQARNYDPYEDEEFKKVFESLNEKYTEQQAKTTMLGTEMLKMVLQLLTKSGADSVKITVDNDFPVRFSTDDFGVIIAPRVED